MHVQGNPHIQLSPRNIRKVAQPLSERLAKLDPAHTGYFTDRLADFLSRWDAAIARWESSAAPLRGKRVVAHHKSFVYLDEWLGLNELATLEPLPGIPPTSTHLAALLDMLGKDGSGADFIIREVYQSPKAAEWLSERTGIPAVMLPTTVGGSPGAIDLFGLFDDILQRLLSVSP
jgi:zinc/manganese transport system substrate-binding protein